MFGVFFGLEIDLILKECSILESTFEWFVHTEFYCSLFFIMWLLKSLLLDVNHIEMSFSFNNVFSLSIHSECVHECCAGDLVDIETGFREWFSIISQLIQCGWVTPHDLFAKQPIYGHPWSTYQLIEPLMKMVNQRNWINRGAHFK